MLYARVAAAALHPGYGCFLPKNITHRPSMPPPFGQNVDKHFSFLASTDARMDTHRYRTVPLLSVPAESRGTCLQKMSAGAENRAHADSKRNRRQTFFCVISSFDAAHCSQLVIPEAATYIEVNTCNKGDS